jgi:hypothetical protein
MSCACKEASQYISLKKTASNSYIDSTKSRDCSKIIEKNSNLKK